MLQMSDLAPVLLVQWTPQEASSPGLVSLVTSLALSPLSLLVWVIEGWVDGKLKENIYKKLR